MLSEVEFAQARLIRCASNSLVSLLFFYILNHSFKLIGLRFDFRFFTDDALEYLEEWSEPMADIRVHAWITLKDVPTWAVVEASMKQLQDYEILNARDSKVHEQHGHVVDYCTDTKIAEWRKNSASTVDRWVDIFKYLAKQEKDYTDFAEIAEYILCLPGTTASVERTFSSINKLWAEEKSQLTVETLKAMIVVKYNFEFTCIEFYNYIRTKPELLKLIASKQKYKLLTEEGETVDIVNSEEE